jgi:putative signal transducing protein
MELRDPVVAYDAATNVEAQLVKMLLTEAGIDAFASEDHSTAGLWMFGVMPEIHKPQVWVSSQDHDRAQLLLQEYEQRVAERQQPDQSVESNAGPAIEVLCEECRKKSSFPSSQKGSVQDCLHCGAYVDVGDGDDAHPFWLGSDDENEE